MTLILGVDRSMYESKALTNLAGNSVATVVVAKWNNQLDEEILHLELNKGHTPEMSRL